MWTEEQREIRGLARDFAEGEIRPRAASWDAERELGDGIFASLSELGFLGMRVPEEHGGLALDWTTFLLVLEELAWGDASLALAVATHAGPVTGLIREHGTEEQKADLLPRLASGELLGAMAFSEPGAGSDLADVETRAERDGDGWVLDGAKAWVAGARRAGLTAVLARTPDDDTALFLVEGRPEGLEVGDPPRTMGLAALGVAPVSLEGVAVPGDRLLGGPSEGMGRAKAALDRGRLCVAAACVGLARSALEHAVRYAGEREQFGRPIARFGGIEEKLGSMAVGLARARALVHVAGRRMEAGTEAADGALGEAGGMDARTLAAMAKVEAAETAVFVADEAIQIFGGYGYMRDYPVERLLRDAKGTEIMQGTNEILRGLISRSLTEEEPTVKEER